MKWVQLSEARVANTVISQILQILLWWCDLYMCLCVYVCVCVRVCVCVCVCMCVCVCVYVQSMQRVQLEDASMANTEILKFCHSTLMAWFLYVYVRVCVRVYTVYETGGAGRCARDQYWNSSKSADSSLMIWFVYVPVCVCVCVCGCIHSLWSGCSWATRAWPILRSSNSANFSPMISPSTTWDDCN